MFYKQRNINVKSFIQNTLKAGGHLSYISPEIGFLKSLSGVLTKATEVIFLFLAEDAMEPTTKQTYKSILAEIASIKTVEVAKTMAVSGVLISIKVSSLIHNKVICPLPATCYKRFSSLNIITSTI